VVSNKPSRIHVLAALYGVLPILAAALGVAARDMGWHLTLFGLNLAFCVALAYVAVGAWVGYSITRTQVRRDMQDWSRHD